MGLSKKNKSRLKNLLLYNSFLLQFYIVINKFNILLFNKTVSDKRYLKRKFRKFQDYDLDLENPKTLNEKLQWLKIYNRKDFHIQHADKFAVREYIRETFGEEYLIPLEFHTIDYKQLIPGNLPSSPMVIKTNHGFGNTVIIRDKSQVDWHKLKMDYKRWLNTNYYYFEREWQYKYIKPRIIIEKLLVSSNGNLPNDYKLNFIDGKLEFIYVSVDREGTNKRNIYDPDWKPLYFTWARKGKDLSNVRGDEILPPPTLEKMIEFGSVVAKQYKYVRVDFYDVDGKLYFGEITQCHGGGFDQMLPYEYDLKFGEKIKLSF